MGLTRPSLCKVCSTSGNPPLEALQAILEALGLACEQFGESVVRRRDVASKRALLASTR